MGKISQFFTKKVVFIISLLSTIGFFVLIPRGVLLSICEIHNSTCFHLLNYILMFLMLGVTIFLPSFISFFIKNEVFDSWKKTLPVYLIIYLLIIILTPWKVGDIYFRIEKDVFAFYACVVYLAFSLIFIAYKASKKL